jgi:hypothetical protein
MHAYKDIRIIILKWLLKKWGMRIWTDFICLRRHGSFEHGNKTSGSLKGEKFY